MRGHVDGLDGKEVKIREEPFFYIYLLSCKPLGSIILNHINTVQTPQERVDWLKTFTRDLN